MDLPARQIRYLSLYAFLIVVGGPNHRETARDQLQARSGLWSLETDKFTSYEWWRVLLRESARSAENIPTAQKSAVGIAHLWTVCVSGLSRW
jgi:hypothetical protein